MTGSAAVESATFHSVCALDDLWAGETRLYTVAGVKLLLVHTEDGEVCAVQSVCPHQGVSLEDAPLSGRVLRCPMHMWEMDVVSGLGINPPHAHLARYPVQVRDGMINVALDGVKVKFSRP